MNKEVVLKGIPFKGQFPLSSNLKSEPGVYIIADRRNKIADIGETENLKERISARKKNKGWHLWFCKEDNPRSRARIKKFIVEKYQLAV
jgi:hypothetical protein